MHIFGCETFLFLLIASKKLYGIAYFYFAEMAYSIADFLLQYDIADADMRFKCSMQILIGILLKKLILSWRDLSTTSIAIIINFFCHYFC